MAGLVRERHFEHDLVADPEPLAAAERERVLAVGALPRHVGPEAPGRQTIRVAHGRVVQRDRATIPDTVLDIAIWPFGYFSELVHVARAAASRHAQRRPLRFARAVLVHRLQTRLEVPDETELPPRSSAASFLSALGHRLTKRTRAAHWCMYMLFRAAASVARRSDAITNCRTMHLIRASLPL